MDEKVSLKKVLGFWDIFCLASGAMISSGLFILPGLAYAKAGPAVIFAYILGGILVIPSMFSVALTSFPADMHKQAVQAVPGTA